MTAAEVIEACRATIGKPLNGCQTRIGFPREQSAGGPAMAKLADRIAQHGFDPWFIISARQAQMLTLELGRSICASGDTLFGLILVGVDDTDEDIRWLREHRGDDAIVDCRGDFK